MSKPFADLRSFHTCRDAVTILKFPKYTLLLPRPVILPKGYVSNPESLGEHIRKIRMDKGLTQEDVAGIIGITESTVWNWEHSVGPDLRHMPKIIEFLGYVPFECPGDTLGRLRYFKTINGLKYER